MKKVENRKENYLRLLDIQKLADTKVCESFQAYTLDEVKKDHQDLNINNDDIEK